MAKYAGARRTREWSAEIRPLALRGCCFLLLFLVTWPLSLLRYGILIEAWRGMAKYEGARRMREWSAEIQPLALRGRCFLFLFFVTWLLSLLRYGILIVAWCDEIGGRTTYV